MELAPTSPIRSSAFFVAERRASSTSHSIT